MAKAKKKSKTKEEFKHTAIMAAGGKALADGRMIKLRDAIREGDSAKAEKIAGKMIKVYGEALSSIIEENI